MAPAATPQFCCRGCRAAYELIHRLSLHYYYELQDDGSGQRVGLSTAPRASVDYSYFDEPAFFKTFTESENSGDVRITFHSDTLHCSACVWLLERLPAALPGVSHVRVDLARQRITVLFNPTICSLSELGSALFELGYEPHPIAINPAERVAQKGEMLFTLQLGVAAFCAMNVMLLFIGRYQGLFTGMEAAYAGFFAWISFFLAVPAVAFSALPFYRTSLAGLRAGRVHIDLPIAIAIVGGFCVSAVNTVLGRPDIYFDTVTALVFLLLLGRWFKRRGLARVAVASELLYAVAPLSAEIIGADGVRKTVFVESLSPGHTVAVAPKSRIPCDGTLVSESGLLNNAFLTGESSPRRVHKGEEIYCGAMNSGPEIVLLVTAVGEATRLGKLLRDVETAPLRESRITEFTDRVAKYFVFGVLALAGGTFIVVGMTDLQAALDRVFALLIVSCPCALGIATPIVLSLASAEAARRGILLRRGTVLEQIGTVSEAWFDKTGTLTKGELFVDQSWFFSQEFSTDSIKHVIGSLEDGVEHPVAEALRSFSASAGTSPPFFPTPVDFHARGVSATDRDGRNWKLGALDWISAAGSPRAAELAQLLSRTKNTSLVGLAVDNRLIASFSLRDVVRPEARKLVQMLTHRGIECGILSGDAPEVVMDVAREVGITSDRAFGSMTPEEKTAFVQKRKRPLIFVGDGVNDATALSAAGVGIGIRGGAEICLKVSDVFLLRPDLELISDFVNGAGETMTLIRRHLMVSLFYNITAASLAVTGCIGPLAAALIMPASSLTVIAVSLYRRPFREQRSWR